MATPKEAIVICLDVGASMQQHDDPVSDLSRLDKALHCLSMILQRKIFTESKDEVALVLMGSRDTENEMANEAAGGGDGADQYQHIRVVRGLALPTWDLVKFVESDIDGSEFAADFVDALVVSMDVLVREMEGKKFGLKSIILVSDLAAPANDDSLQVVLDNMQQLGVDLTYVGPSALDGDGSGTDPQQPGPSWIKKSESVLEDDQNGGDEGPSNHLDGASAQAGRKPKSAVQRRGERLMRNIIAQLNAVGYSFDQALETVAYFQRRSVRPAAWYCDLTLGDGASIAIGAYKKVEAYKPKQSWKPTYAADPDAELISKPTHHLNDEDQTTVDKEDIVKAYRYGTTLVPFDKLDQETMKYKADKQLRLISFYPADQIQRHLYSDNCSWVMVADPREKDDTKPAATALTSLVVALKEQGKVAVARYVYRSGTQPKIMVLLPVVKLVDGQQSTLEVESWKDELLQGNVSKAFFVMIQLPFFEDVRDFVFPTLEQQPSADQTAAIDSLIDNLDLTNYIPDATGVKAEDRIGDEIMRQERIPNPYIQRLFYSMQQRALYPDNPLPDLPEELVSLLDIPDDLASRGQSAAGRIAELYSLKESEIKAKKKQQRTAAGDFKDEENEPETKAPRTTEPPHGDLTSLANATRMDSVVERVGTVNPDEDFRAMLATKKPDTVEAAFTQISNIIIQLVFESYKTSSYAKAIKTLRVMREEAITESKASEFNAFLQTFKRDLPSKNRRDFWELIVKEKLSLISSTESAAANNVTMEESEAFLATEAAKGASAPQRRRDDDDDADVLDMLE